MNDVVSIANYAVKVAREQFGKSLDFSEKTLSDLDSLLELAINRVKEYRSEGKDVDANIKRTANVWGSYLGEVIRRELGGKWVVVDHETLLTVNGTNINPIRYVYARIKNGTIFTTSQFLISAKQDLNSQYSRNPPHNYPVTTKYIGKNNNSTSGVTYASSGSRNKGIGCIIAIIVIIVLYILGAISSSNNSSTPRQLTIQEEKALEAVQGQRTILADNMHQSIGVIFVLLENEGHTASVDGWYVSSSNDHISVYFYFFYDGKRENAEWWYYPNGIIVAKNDWAFTLMGQ